MMLVSLAPMKRMDDGRSEFDRANGIRVNAYPVTSWNVRYD